MLFQQRLDRARQLQRQQRGLTGDEDRQEGCFDDSGAWQEPERPDISDELEKHDMLALMLSGMLAVFLPAALILAALALLACLLFGVL